jgi:hypothetical protein
VSPTEPLDPRRELSPTELVILDVLRAHGPLDVMSAAALAAKSGINEATAAFVLRYSPITRSDGLRRVAPCGPGTVPLAAAA